MNEEELNTRLLLSSLVDFLEKESESYSDARSFIREMAGSLDHLSTVLKTTNLPSSLLDILRTLSKKAQDYSLSMDKAEEERRKVVDTLSFLKIEEDIAKEQSHYCRQNDKREPAPHLRGEAQHD